MPQMDGLEATRRIRKDARVTTQPHIIAMTANVSNVDRDDCKRAGIDDFVGSPSGIEELAVALSRCAPADGGILDERIIDGLRQLEALESIGRVFLEGAGEALGATRRARPARPLGPRAQGARIEGEQRRRRGTARGRGERSNRANGPVG